jgi:hypothetical protein
MKTKQTCVIVSPEYDKHSRGPALLRITLAKDFSKFDFGYQTTDYYIRGGWVKISKDTCLLCSKTNKQLKLVRAENIPLGPSKHRFKTTKDWLYYSLIFPPIDNDTKVIDLLEDIPGSPNDFNYYNIQLDRKQFILVETDF